MKRTAVLCAVAVSIALAPAALAAAGKTWTCAGAEQFAQGKLVGVSVLSTGEVQLAPPAEKIEGLQGEFVWDAEAADDGTVYVATGAPAAVYAIRGNRAEVVYKSDQPQVLSVLPLPDGTVMVGTAPKGIVFRIGRTGQAAVLAELKEAAYVWDMALGPRGEVYCATGPQGRLIELDRGGRQTEMLHASQSNLMCVVVDKEGTVYAGSDTDGYVYVVPRRGKASVLYDAEEEEVHALAVDDDGVLYACTAQGRPSGSPEGSSAERSAGSSPARTEPVAPTRPPSAGAPSAYNSIYRIEPVQGAALVVRFDRTFILSLALSGGRLLAGTGTGGRVMAVWPDLRHAVLSEFDAAHVSAMAVQPSGEVVVATSNPAGLWRMGPGSRQKGSYLSKPFDADYLSRWGRLSWKQQADAHQQVRLRLRTGQSAQPDQYWSDWSDWIVNPDGQEPSVPMGRFAQYQAELSAWPGGGTPLLVEVTASYRQVNRRPRVEDLAMDGQSLLGKEERGGQGPPGGRPGPQPGPGPRQAPEQMLAQRTIAWKAADPNEDGLFFDLYYRGLDEAEWKELKKDIRDEASYVWDTSRVPDGYYLLRLVARDGVLGAGSDALADEKVSRPLLVDNRGPAVAELSAGRRTDGSYELSGVTRDDLSAIAGIEVSHNSGDWQPVQPADGILDSPAEGFTFRTEVLKPGEHVFVFAAKDARGNTGSGKVVVKAD
jgi:hypothetical protein